MQCVCDVGAIRAEVVFGPYGEPGVRWKKRCVGVVMTTPYEVGCSAFMVVGADAHIRPRAINDRPYGIAGGG